MNPADLTHRFSRFEADLEELSGKEWSDEELITAMVSGTATPLQMSRVYDRVEADIRAAVVLYAASARRCREEEGGRRVSPLFPVDVASEIVSYPPGSPLPTWGTYSPAYDPESWAGLPHSSPSQTWAPRDFAWWARSFLMQRLLGNDRGLALREGFDSWWQGGDPPIDPDRYPDERIYWLLEPIDTVASILDRRLLRRPTPELYWRIGTYDRFDVPDDGHEWT